VNQDCSFKADKLDEENLISLLKCLNANGALPKTVQFMEAAGKENLTPIVRTLNEKLISNKERLYEIEASHETLINRKISKKILEQIGLLLNNGEFVSRLISILKDGFTVPERTVNPDSKSDRRVPDPDLLQAISLLSKGLSEDVIQKAFRMGLNVSGANSFKTLNGDFHKGLSSVKSLSNLTDGLYYFNRTNHTYYCDKDHPAEDIRGELFQAIRNEDLFTFLDDLFEVSKSTRLHGGPADPLKDRISTLALVLKTLTKDPGNDQDELIKKLGVAFKELIPQTISCVNHGAQISNPALLIVKELSERKRANPDSSDLIAKEILQSYPLQFMALRPFCTLPDNLDTHYSTLRELARIEYKVGSSESVKPLIDPLAGILSTAYFGSVREWKGCGKSGVSSRTEEYHLIANLFLHILSDIDPTLNTKKSSHASKAGLDYLLPLFREISSRDAWLDILLVSTLPGKKDRDDLKALTLYLVEPRTQLRGKSIADVFVDTLAREKSPVKLYKLVSSLSNYSKLDNDFLEQSLLLAREAFYSNNVHPVFELIRDILKEAPKNPEFFSALLNISELDEFSEAISELSDMTKDDRLEAVIAGMVKVFHRFAEQGKNLDIQETEVRPFVSTRRHNFTRDQLTEFTLKNKPDSRRLNLSQECDRLLFDVSMFKASDSRSAEQLKYFIKCLNSDGSHDDLRIAVETLQEYPSRFSSSGSLFDIQVGMVRKLEDGLSSSHTSALIEHWKSYYTQKTAQGVLYLNNVLDGIGLFIRGRPVVSGDQTTGPILGPLAKLFGKIVGAAQNEVKELKNFAAKTLESNSFPKLAGDIRSIYSRSLEEAPSTDSDLPVSTANPQLAEDPFVREVWRRAWHGPVANRFTPEFILRVKEWVKNKECDGLSGRDDDPELLRRVVRVLSEPRDTVNNWELVSEGRLGLSRGPRKNWEFYEFKRWLEKIVKKLAQTESREADPRNRPRKKLIDAQLDFLKYFSMPVNRARYQFDGQVYAQFTPDWLAKWFFDRAIDYQPITYFYPGESKPRVRIVNTLDKFELVTLNGDFIAPYLNKNLGLKNLALLGDAWGDIPDRSKWPAEIRAKYPGSNYPPTILEAVREISSPRATFWNIGSWLGTEDIHTLGFYIMGLPRLPACHRDIEGAIDPQASGYLSYLFDRSYQARLYNIMQVIHVMEENAPGSRTGYGYGLEFFRDLFFELNYSSPQNALAIKDDIEQALDQNNLTVVSYSNKLGLLRLAGTLLHNVERDDPALKDLFYLLVHAAKTPRVREFLKTTYETTEGRDVFWNLVREMFYIVKNADGNQIKQLRGTLYYAFATINRLEPWTPPSAPYRLNGELDRPELVDKAVQRLHEVIQNPELTEFLAQDHDGLLRDVLTSDLSYSLFRKTYSSLGMPEDAGKAERIRDVMMDFLSTTSADGTSLVQDGMKTLKVIHGNRTLQQEAWDLASKTRGLLNSDEWARLEFENSALPLVYLFEHLNMNGTAEASQEEKLASDQLRKNLASILRSQDLEELALLASEKPDKFNQILMTLNRYIGYKNQGELKDFLKQLHQRLSAPKH
jgi:hypothetical protein